MLQWEQSNRNEASDVYDSICALRMFMPSMCLLEAADKENHLDRLVSRFVASPLVHSPSGVATSFWEPVANRIGSRICALRWAADLSVRKNQVSDMVWDLCSAKQGPKRKNRWTQLTDMLRVAQGTLEGLFFFAQSYAVSMWFGAPGIKPVEEMGLVDVPKMCWLEVLRNASPKHSAVIPMFRGFAWWPSDECTFTMEFVADWVRVPWRVSPTRRNRQMRHTAVSQLNSRFSPRGPWTVSAPLKAKTSFVKPMSSRSTKGPREWVD